MVDVFALEAKFWGFDSLLGYCLEIMSKFYKENQNNLILNQLVSENCLSFGRSPKLNNRKITHYLSGTRQKVDIFNLYEMRYLLLKVYPLIHNLFLLQRINLKKKKNEFSIKFLILKKIHKNSPNSCNNEKISVLWKRDLINLCVELFVRFYQKFYLPPPLKFIVPL